jgi:aryl-alcohol dehydrogenase-like predicted oxidoreductase
MTWFVRGKVLYAGISDAPAWWIPQVTRSRTCVNGRPLSVCRSNTALIGRTVERELIPMAEGVERRRDRVGSPFQTAY